MQQAEIDRLERLAEWRDARLRTNAMADAMRSGRVPEPRPAPGRAPVQDPVVLHGRPGVGPGSDCHATPATAVDRSERPGPNPRGSAPGLQGVPGRRARHRGRRRGARRADARPPAVGRSRGDRRRLERAQDRVQRNLRALVPRACRARDRDSPDAAPLLQRPDPGRRLHVPGHGRGRRDLAPEPVHLRCRVRRLHGDDRARPGVRRTARRGMVGREPDDPHDRGRERVLLVPRRADDGRAARARPRRALLPDLRAGDLGAGGARDRDPARAPCSSPGCSSSRSRSCSGDGSARSWSTRSTAS